MSDKANTVLQLNFGERLIISNISADARGTASVVRTIKRVRHAVGIRELLDKQVTLAEMYAQDENVLPCNFSADAFEWLVKTYGDKADWPGAWADWIASLGDKLDAERIAQTIQTAE